MKLAKKKLKTVKKSIGMKAIKKPSNENKKLVSINADMDQPIVTSPQIDKMVVLVDIPDPALHGLMVHELLCAIEEKEPGFKQEKGKGKYPVAVSIFCPDENGEIHSKGPAVLFQATSKHCPKPQVRLTFNPYKLFGPVNALMPDAGNPVQDHLDSVFLGLWGDGFFSFLFHGRVTYLEVWRHILFRSPDDYLFHVAYAKNSQPILGPDQKLQTQYFGKRTGDQTAIYNKAKQLDKDADHDCIRVEVRIKRRNMKIGKLWGLENPLNRVKIYSLYCKQPPVSDGHWTAFKDSCRLWGVGKAIKKQPKSDQYKLKQAVSENPVAWWQIDDSDWDDLWLDALAFAGLDNIPNHAPPLDLLKINGSH